MKNEYSAAEILAANLKIYELTAKDYDAEQPHFSPENKELFSSKLKMLSETAGNSVLVDLGCGTGFVTELSMPYFQQIYGVDISPNMLALVKTDSGKVKVIAAPTDSVPLEDGISNVVTSNSFLHHLFDYESTLREAYRLLKEGGVFYSEEDPNRLFWDGMKDLNPDSKEYSDIVKREIDNVKLEEFEMSQFKDDKEMFETLAKSEYQKMIKGGMSMSLLNDLLLEIGFSKVKVEPYWYLGQGFVMHNISFEAAKTIEDYLLKARPLSDNLFKYFRIEAWK
jgi:ubiquinone/menaquinone biosynthesis C-methylase UbiE